MSTTPVAGAPAQVGRLLTLVPYLYSRDHVRLEDAARDLRIPPAQLLKDLKVLLMCGLPGGYPDDLIDVDLDALEGPEGDGVIRVSNADYLARPLRLTPTEATAVIVALRALRTSAAAETGEVVDRVLAKLEAAVAEGTAAGRVDPGAPDPGPSASTEALEAQVAEAVAAGRQMRLTYFVPSRDELSDRVVDPRGVVRAEGVAYVDAYCHAADAPRLFRLDRVRAAEVLESALVTEPQAPRDLSQGPLAGSESLTTVTVRLDPHARWVLEYYPLEDARPATGDAPEGSLDAELRVADERWLTRFLLRLAPHATVLAPAEFTEGFTAAARATLSLYEVGDVPSS